MAGDLRGWHDPVMPKKPAPIPVAQTRRPTFLRQWRKFNDLSQHAACDRFADEDFDITQGTLSKIERGELPYNQDLLEHAAKIYHCTVAALLTVNPLGKADPLPKALSDLENMPTEIRRQVANVIAAMIKPPT